MTRRARSIRASPTALGTRRPAAMAALCQGSAHVALRGPQERGHALAQRYHTRGELHRENGVIAPAHERSRSACKAQSAMAGPANVGMRTQDPRHHRSTPRCHRCNALLYHGGERRVHGFVWLRNAMAGRSICT